MMPMTSAQARKDAGGGVDVSPAWDSIARLEGWLGGNYQGWDPYDGAYSDRIRSLRWGRSFVERGMIQLHRLSPINLRDAFGVRKGVSIKGLSLFTQGFLNLFAATGREEYLREAKRLSELIIDDSLVEEVGKHAWASHYFSFVSLDGGATPPDTPDLIGTCHVLKALTKLHQVTAERRLKAIIESCQSFLAEKIERRDDLHYFQYAPQYQGRLGKIVPNASAEAIGSIALSFRSHLDEELRDKCDRVLEMLLRMQREDGSWVYSIYPNGREYDQQDFHQGSLVSGLVWYREFAPLAARDALDRAIMRGSACYRGMFSDDGRGIYRAPRKYPADAHNQAQGIITFAQLSEAYGDRPYLELANRIACWTISNMQDESGYFYYHKGRLLTNKIPYMRWSQGWMFLALSDLLSQAGNTALHELP